MEQAQPPDEGPHLRITAEAGIAFGRVEARHAQRDVHGVSVPGIQNENIRGFPDDFAPVTCQPSPIGPVPAGQGSGEDGQGT